MLGECAHHAISYNMQCVNIKVYDTRAGNIRDVRKGTRVQAKRGSGSDVQDDLEVGHTMSNGIERASSSRVLDVGARVPVCQ